MQEREENFFTRNRKLIFYAAIIVLLLNVAVYFLVPQQKTVKYSGVVTEYSLTDSSFAAEHEAQIDGYFMNSIVLGDTFTGTFAVEGVQGAEPADKAELLQDGRLWQVRSQDGAAAEISGVRYDRENGVWLISLRDPDHFIAIGISGRPAACWRYAEAFGLHYQPEA